jgi:hypothetical protein
MLRLSDLRDGNIPAITPSIGSMLAEAASVCLESQGHRPGVFLLIRGSKGNDYRVTWEPITAQARDRAWNDESNATEWGAVGIAILLAKPETGYDVIDQSRKGTGFDYWLGDASDDPVFQRKARLEVSGIRQGDDRDVRARVTQKLRQTDRSARLSIRAYVIVVEFGRPLAEVRQR